MAGNKAQNLSEAPVQDPAASSESESKTESKPKRKREKDTSPAGQIIDAARGFRKAYRSMGGARPDKIDEARHEAAKLRKRVAELVDKPEEMDKVYKEMRRAEGRVDRMLNTDGNKKTEAIDKLKELKALVDNQLVELEESDDE